MRLIADIKRKARKTLLIFLVMLLAAGPSWPVLAGETAAQEEKTFFEALTDAYDHMRKDVISHIPGLGVRNFLSLFGIIPEREKLPTGKMVEDELTTALNALSNLNASILKDQRLAEALDEIIWELLEEESFTRGLHERQAFIADIIRDDRLINIIGEVIADYLSDDKLAEDIELFFSILFDLIADRNMHNFFKETLARLIEDDRTSKLIDEILAASVRIAYESSTDAVAALTADDRIKEIVKELIALFIVPAPEMAAQFVGDERLVEITGDLAEVIIMYGPDMTAQILEDHRFQTLFSDIVMVIFELLSRTLTGTLEDQRLTGLIGHVFGNVAEGLDGGTLGDIVGTMVDDFFKCDEFRDFVDPAFAYLMEESQERAFENTPEDYFTVLSVELEINRMKELAYGVAEVPPELAYLAAFNWMVYGEAGLDISTYTDIALEFTGLITPELVLGFGAVFAGIINHTVPRLIEENKEEIAEVLEAILDDEEIFVEAANYLRDDPRSAEFPEILAGRIITHLPFEQFADTIREDEYTVNTLIEVTGELIDMFPLREIGRFIRDDERIPGLIDDSFTGVPVDKIAALIREDDRIFDLIRDIVHEFPVGTVSQFLQGEVRAEIIGHSIANFFLQMVADFVEKEGLSNFVHTILTDILESFDEPAGKVFLDNLARFYESDRLAPYLAGSFVGFVYEAKPDMHAAYKQVVPNFFTRMIFGIR